MQALWAAISVICWLTAIFLVNQATMGVVAMGAACWFAVLAHMAQQERLHRQLLAALKPPQ